MIDHEIIQAVAQFGSAGLMGTLWVWERTMSRKRETQLTAAHDRLMQNGQTLHELMSTVQRNTRAIEHFEASLASTRELLERIYRDENQRAA
ncbi:MAG: hypothetical protein AAF800_09510 [Planctomycetota bacterium]